MTNARFKVHFAGPLVTFQDAGRIGHLRFGVPASGPMDRFSFAAAHAALAQEQSGTAIEVSLGGLVLECVEGSCSIALAGGNFRTTCAGHESTGWGVHNLQTGDKVSIRAGAWGSWTYLAFAGQLQITSWLGHSATHALSDFGGGALTAGDVLTVNDAKVLDSRVGEIPIPDLAKPSPRVQVVLGPQDPQFAQSSVDAFQTDTFHVTDAFDRMGMRLDGPKLTLNDALSIPSEPIMRGSVQVSGDGAATVLLADHQTTGGYPKIATVLSSETDRLSQNRSGDPLSFMAITPETAARDSAIYRTAVDAYLAGLAQPKASLSERLMSTNLIDGVVDGTED